MMQFESAGLTGPSRADMEASYQDALKELEFNNPGPALQAAERLCRQNRSDLAAGILARFEERGDRADLTDEGDIRLYELVTGLVATGEQRAQESVSAGPVLEGLPEVADNVVQLFPESPVPDDVAPMEEERKAA